VAKYFNLLSKEEMRLEVKIASRSQLRRATMLTQKAPTPQVAQIKISQEAMAKPMEYNNPKREARTMEIVYR
jgi:hypothetical protein